MSDLSRHCQIDLIDEPDGLYLTVTARTIEAEADWWQKATAGSIWTVDHLEAGPVNFVRASRKVRNRHAGRLAADRVGKQINKSLDRFYAAQAAADRARALEEQDAA